MSKRREKRMKKKLLGRLENNRKSIFGDTDLTPYNFGKRSIVYK